MRQRSLGLVHLGAAAPYPSIGEAAPGAPPLALGSCLHNNSHLYNVNYVKHLLTQRRSYIKRTALRGDEKSSLYWKLGVASEMSEAVPSLAFGETFQGLTAQPCFTQALSPQDGGFGLVLTGVGLLLQLGELVHWV